MRVLCPCCDATPPVKRWEDEDFVAYTYRKWKWLANHIVTDHARQLALTHRHRMAVKKGDGKLKEVKILKPKRHKAA